MRGCARRAAEGGGETVGNKWRCPWCATALLSAVLLLLATPPGASGAGLPARIPARDGAGPRAGHGGFTASLLGHMRASVSCTRGGAAVLGAEGLAEVLRPPPYLRGDGCGAGRQRSAEKSTGLGSARVAAPWALRGAGEENAEHSEDGNQTKAVCNTDGGCPHGRHSDNPDEQHCMECEVMAFLQRAANLLQQAGGRIESTIFAEQWTELYPEDPLTPEQVATAVAGILKESGYFHVEETSDPAVKLFELIEQADDGGGIGDCPQTICLPFELSPPEQVSLSRARASEQAFCLSRSVSLFLSFLLCRSLSVFLALSVSFCLSCSVSLFRSRSLFRLLFRSLSLARALFLSHSLALLSSLFLSLRALSLSLARSLAHARALSLPLSHTHTICRMTS